MPEQETPNVDPFNRSNLINGLSRPFSPQKFKLGGLGCLLAAGVAAAIGGVAMVYGTSEAKNGVCVTELSSTETIVINNKRPGVGEYKYKSWDVGTNRGSYTVGGEFSKLTDPALMEKGGLKQWHTYNIESAGFRGFGFTPHILSAVDQQQPCGSAAEPQ